MKLFEISISTVMKYDCYNYIGKIWNQDLHLVKN